VLSRSMPRRDDALLFKETMRERIPCVVIVAGGFGGMVAAKALRKRPAEVERTDRNSHHLFQPLLYQVAKAMVAPGQIESPIRSTLGNQENIVYILSPL
jgi:NADH:ubiquinone reductase (H+-translocating)